MRMRRPGSKSAHVIVKVPIVERPGSLFPLLILADGNPSLLAATYARDLQRSNWSPEMVYGAVAALGRLYDFYHIKLNGVAQEPRQLRMMLQQFAEARLHGTIQPNGGTDPSGLNWHPVRYNTARKDVHYITRFSRWVAANLGGEELNPLEDKYWSSVRESYLTSIHMNVSVLPPRAERHQRPQFELHNDTGGHKRDIPKAFPPDKFLELIEATPNPRDQMAFILMGLGSLRISDTIHLFLEDVVGAFRDTGAAYVTLGHPVEGHYEWINQDSQPRSGTRADYLIEVYGRVPRNRMEGTDEYAGWKGMEFGDAKNTGFVYWAIEEAGIFFRSLVNKYFNEVFRGRPEGWPGHPYLFVKLDRSHYGEPLTIANLANQFYASCKRIGLDRRMPGVNPHGLRHMYGFLCADVLGIALERLQNFMHHASSVSTKIYSHVSPLKVREHLLEAQQRLREQGRQGGELKPEIKAIASTAEQRNLVSDPFGLLNYFRGRILV